MLKKLLIAALIAASTICGKASAQSAMPTTNLSGVITTGLTFQVIQGASDTRRSLTVENNNTNGDNCWVNVDGSVNAGDTTSTSKTLVNGATTAAKASILLGPSGGSYTRYYPYVPRGQIAVTCATSSDSIYVDVQ